MKTYRIATIPGDGIGKEVVPAGRSVLEAIAAGGAFAFEFEDFGWGGDWFRAHGEMMPADGLDALRDKDAILFGSAGDPHIPDHVTLWGLRLKICQGLDQYANVRPTRILPGIDAPLKRCRREDLDWVIVRENSEGEYSGVGGRVHQGLPIEVATDVSMMTRAGVERILRFAFRLARSRPRKLLTVVTKSNAQRHAMVMWDEIAVEVAREFADVRWDKELVDAATARMVNRPASLDTLVATNLHADILSDLAAALAGSLGIAPTAQHRSRAPLPVDVRADPRLGLRHHGQGARQSDRHVLVVRDDARASRRGRRGGAPDERDRAGHGRAAPAHPRSRRQGDDRRGHERGVRRLRGARRAAR